MISVNESIYREFGKYKRRSKGALYTVCSVGFFVPVILSLGMTIFQSALTYYSQQRLDFVAKQVIEQFDTLTAIDPNRFDKLLSTLAAVNSLRIHGLRSRISSSTEGGEEIFEIKLTGQFDAPPGVFLWNQNFQKIYKVKSSDLDQFGYLAINAYPYCQINPGAGDSVFLPLHRPSKSVSTWNFYQDNAIGSLRKTMCDKNDDNDQNPENWMYFGEKLISVY